MTKSKSNNDVVVDVVVDIVDNCNITIGMATAVMKLQINKILQI